MVEDELMSVDCCPAATSLETDWSPSPTFTPGLMFAPALMSVLLMPTLASTPTLGLALIVGSTVTCAWALPYAAITAAAARLMVKCMRFMLAPFSGGISRTGVRSPRTGRGQPAAGSMPGSARGRATPRAATAATPRPMWKGAVPSRKPEEKQNDRCVRGRHCERHARAHGARRMPPGLYVAPRG